jgi:ABC-type multidrug transport system fused ATPase/permease subunit
LLLVRAATDPFLKFGFYLFYLCVFFKTVFFFKQQQIEEAAKEAQIYDFIMRSPLQFETMVGERGLRLSGGDDEIFVLMI